MSYAESLRLAREIHDWVGNEVSLALRQLDLYAIGRARNDPAAEHQVQEARRTLELLLDRTRGLVSGLRQQPCGTSLEVEVREFIARANLLGTATTVVLRGEEVELPSRVRDELFMVIREALRNAFTHAQAQHVNVTIDITANEVRARVEDDGIGGDSGWARSGGSGLTSMRERIALLGGRLTVSSRDGAGTLISAEIDTRRSQCGG